jgi:hypothetical protein
MDYSPTIGLRPPVGIISRIALFVYSPIMMRTPNQERRTVWSEVLACAQIQQHWHPSSVFEYVRHLTRLTMIFWSITVLECGMMRLCGKYIKSR